MINYSQSKIYKITDLTNGNVIFGSTNQLKLSRRLAELSHKYNKWLIDKKNYLTVFQIFENDSYRISLVDTPVVSGKDELNSILNDYIEKFDCLNKL